MTCTSRLWRSAILARTFRSVPKLCRATSPHDCYVAPLALGDAYQDRPFSAQALSCSLTPRRLRFRCHNIPTSREKEQLGEDTLWQPGQKRLSFAFPVCGLSRLLSDGPRPVLPTSLLGRTRLARGRIKLGMKHEKTTRCTTEFAPRQRSGSDSPKQAKKLNLSNGTVNRNLIGRQ